MKRRDLVTGSLVYYWRTHLAVVAGIAVAVAVLAGALLVGDSVRGSLRALVLERLGRTDRVVLSTGFFREDLAEDLRAAAASASQLRAVVPIVIARGVVTQPDSGRVAREVQVFGVDDRFWAFHDVSGLTGPSSRDVLTSPALASELGVAADDVVLVRVQRPSEMPLESLHGRKDNLGRTMRLTVAEVLPPARMGVFSLAPSQSDVLAVFVSLSRLQDELDVPARANALLVASASEGTSAGLDALIRATATPEDLEIALRVLEGPAVVEISSPAGLLDDARSSTVVGSPGTELEFAL